MHFPQKIIAEGSTLPSTKMKQRTFIENTPSTFLTSCDVHKADILPYTVSEVQGLFFICVIKKPPNWLKLSENASKLSMQIPTFNRTQAQLHL